MTVRVLGEEGPLEAVGALGVLDGEERLGRSIGLDETTGGGGHGWGGTVEVVEGEEAMLSSRVLITSDARDVDLTECFL